MDKLTFGSLFSGIGGLDLGLERARMQCAWQVENNEFCQKVLAKHWPNVARHGDVRTVGKDNLKRVDLIAGGFPCQPHSQAGERKASQDERDLWPEFYRLICELEPRWVVAENVLGLLSSEDGAFFGGILRDLAEAGYDARWQVLSAAQFGAPHLRERVIIVAHAQSPELAYASGQRCEEWDTTPVAGEQGHAARRKIAPGRPKLANPEYRGCKWGMLDTNQPSATLLRSGTTQGPELESEMGRAIDGLPSWLDRYRWPARPGQSQEAWEAPRVVTEKKINRTARLKGLGNAVVPALAEYVGRCIMAAEAEREVLV